LPKEIFDEEKFLELSEYAVHCRVKRIKDIVKLKLRTKRQLYTYKTDPTSAERLLRNIGCEIIEI
jgi:large subunit ribosomal protein L38e